MIRTDALLWAKNLGRRSWVCALSVAILAGLGARAGAQPTAPANGPRRTDPGWHALVHATVIPEPGKRLEDATVVFRDGRITSVEEKGAPPAGARVWDCSGLTVYAGLVEAYLPVDARRPDEKSPGTHWNKQVMAQRSALDGMGIDAEGRKKMRGQGFVAAAIAPKGGVFRGIGAVVTLAEAGATSDPLANVVQPEAFHTLSLEANRFGERDYPGSKMGAIALIRQVLSDVPWYARAMEASARNPAENAVPAPDDAAAALGRELPLVFDIDHELDVLRASALAREFGRRAMMVGCGLEFRRLDAVVSAGWPLIVPLSYPDKPEVATEADRAGVELRQLMSWEAAPTNAARLHRAGAKVALTSSKLPKGQEFFPNLREAMRGGLSEEDALAMLTTSPAEMLGLSSRFGRVAPGLSASLVVVKGSLFDKEREVRDVWIEGQRHEVNPTPRVDLEGTWNVSFEVKGEPSPVSGTLKIAKKNEITFERAATEQDRVREKAAKDKAGGAERKPGEEKGDEVKKDEPRKEEPKPEEKKDDTRKFRARHVQLDENRVDFILDGESLLTDGAVLVSAVVEGRMIGGGSLSDGSPLVWSGDRDASAKKDDEKKRDEDSERFAGVPESFGLPFGPFAMDAPPSAKEMWIENATIWTSGPGGIIREGVLHVADGKVKGVYASSSVPKIGLSADAVRVDARGKHITPGLIDCHSHTGISGGVNEGTQSCTSEVRIADVIDPDAIGFYRELAGGLTAANQLHGSANAIGGQNSVVKLRWGAPRAEDLRVQGAMPGIKFALGENVKQSNWGDNAKDRYPQTRMGVETYIRDRFAAAREYAAKWKSWESGPESARATGTPPRRDLELEALAEILAGERLIHCHSYRQDEILMLCRVAGDFGFKIGTFQHVLEGYKVAEAIREHAIGGSCFSDWWAYKFEVVDAIPYDGAIMHDAGVVVSFNSDSDELARRMNLEAAKAVKYGGLKPEEALKFVTINPAKQLKIDHLTGSLEAGKDADFVIWSGDPLSTRTKCEATYIDGREYFSLARDAEMRARADADRRRIIQKLLKKQPEGEGKGAKGEGGGEDRRRGRPGGTEEPPPTDWLTSGGRGSMLAPVGEGIEESRERAAKLALERHYLWLITNGMDPAASHAGDCGCGLNAFFQN
ncbi:MAG: amidohydrolase family protein [Phycisphaerae bacterium]|nr:amidohydrolase family protein [Phycisphaerae bacterium]